MMLFRQMHSVAAILLSFITLCSSIPTTRSSKPTLTILDDGATSGNLTAILKNDIFSLQLGRQYGTKLMYNGKDLVGNATGLYASRDGRWMDFNYTSISIFHETPTWIDVKMSATEGDVHLVVMQGLSGWYSYFVNKGLGIKGEFRTLIRLDGQLFPNGRTKIKNGALPLFTDILNAVKVQDETWQSADGKYITKYDWSSFNKQEDFWGVYGNEAQSGVGVWQISPGGFDYYNGDHNKQELMVHRESMTADAVLLNMLHGTHFQANSNNLIPVNKVFGPWLMYINSGGPPSQLIADAAARTKHEESLWPYKWFLHSTDAYYHARGTVKGKLVLSDNRPASGAAVFLGDPNGNLSITQGSNFYYTTYADENGVFEFTKVRCGAKYQVQAWANGGKIGDVTTVYYGKEFGPLRKDQNKDLGKLVWQTSKRKKVWQIGDADRKSDGFQYGNTGYAHAVVDKCPANLTYTIGQPTSSWPFAKSANGTWRILFDLPSPTSAANTIYPNATLILSLAGYSGPTIQLGGAPSDNATFAILVNTHAVAKNPLQLLNDPSLYRSSTTAGEWRYLEFLIRGSWLKEGRNEIDLVTLKATQWRGLMWDYLKMEWNE